MTVDTVIEILTVRRACMECVMGNGSCEDCDHAFDMAIEKLEDSRWIPVTERLPEEEGAYIVTERDKDMEYPCYVMREWYVNGKWSRVDTLGFEVTAWMPLPEPYEEGAEE